MSSIIKVDTIQNQSGANIISESSNTITVGASGDTITIPSGATISNSGTATGFGANTPNVSLFKGTDQSLADNTVTKITFNTETFDSDNAWSSNTFTVPSGKDGKYFIQFGFQTFNSNETIRNAGARIYKNGSLYESSAGEITHAGNNMRHVFIQAIKVIDLVATDTIEFYGIIDLTTGTPVASGDSYANIYRIIE